ncbi:MAG: DUF2057 domain-containing protein [Aeromonadaceae bacterium]
MRAVLSLILFSLSLCAQAATLELRGPLELLATTPEQSVEDKRLSLAPGEHQLLVRYLDVIPSRSNSENDQEFRSEPQVLRFTIAGNESLVLSAPSLQGEKAMEQFAKQPKLELSGLATTFVQDVAPLTGFVLGVDYQDLLANYNRGSGPAVLVGTPAVSSASKAASNTTVATTAAVATAATAEAAAKPATSATPTASDKEQALQQLFLQASPAERKRFMSWAVQQF